MNFLRYPLTLKNFFLNQKNPHRAKFLGCRIIRNPNYRNFRFTIGGVHPEPHLRQIWLTLLSKRKNFLLLQMNPSNRTNQEGMPTWHTYSDMHTMHFPQIWCKSKNKVRCPTSGHLTFSTYLLTVKSVPRIHHQDQ